LGHTPIVGNDRRCGCGAIGCLETLTSYHGLLASFAASSPKAARTWEALSSSIAEQGIAPWLAKTLDTAAAVIAGALNVLGVRRVVITGALVELPDEVFSGLSTAIARGILWARFGQVKIEKAPRRRNAGLVAAGLDRLVVPMGDS
jgi:predicted NBD/HSP70 family sugar kinase